MEEIVNLLPVKWQPKAKSVIAAIGSLLVIVVAVVPVMPKWAAAVLGVLTYLGVYHTPAPGYVAPSDQVAA